MTNIDTNTPKQTALALVPPPMPETLEASHAALLLVMEMALQRFYAEDSNMRQLLSTIQSQDSITGSVSQDNAYAAFKLHSWCQGQDEFASIVALDMKEFITLFRKARRKLGVDSTSRLKLAKQAAAA